MTREISRQTALEKPKRKDPRGRERFAEYRRFDDAFNCSFKEWLKVRKTQWYDDMKNERLPHPELRIYA